MGVQGKTQSYKEGRAIILTVSNINGDFNKLKELVSRIRPSAVLHTGNFGFLDKSSIERLNERTLQTLVQNSSVISPERKRLLLSYPSKLFKSEITVEDLSGFSQYVSGANFFSVPIYTTHGSLDDIVVLESLKSQPIKNLHFVHDSYAPLINCGDISVRVFGLGGLFLRNKLFDHGCGSGTMAGGEEGSWATLLQYGTLIDTARECESPKEVRILMTYTDPSDETILSQLASAVKADYTLSSNHGGSCSSGYTHSSIYSDFSQYSARLERSHNLFSTLYSVVRPHYEKHLENGHLRLVNLAEKVILQLPPPIDSGLVHDDSFYRNTWHYSLCEISRGHVLFVVNGTQVQTEVISYGVNFEHRARAKMDRKPDDEVDVSLVERQVPWIRADNSDQSPRQVINALSNGIPQPLPRPVDQPVDPKPIQAPEVAARPDTPISATSVDDQGNWADDTAEKNQWEDEVKRIQSVVPTSEPSLGPQEVSLNKVVTRSPITTPNRASPSPSLKKDSAEPSELGLPTSRWSKQEHDSISSVSTRFGVSRADARSSQASPVGSENGNAWGIEFVYCERGVRTSIYEAKGRLVYVQMRDGYEPRTIIEELFYDLQPEIIRIYLIPNESYILVEIKDPDRVLPFSKEISKREYRGRLITANPKKDRESSHYNSREWNRGSNHHRHDGRYQNGSRMSNRDNYQGDNSQYPKRF